MMENTTDPLQRHFVFTAQLSQDRNNAREEGGGAPIGRPQLVFYFLAHANHSRWLKYPVVDWVEINIPWALNMFKTEF